MSAVPAGNVAPDHELIGRLTAELAAGAPPASIAAVLALDREVAEAAIKALLELGGIAKLLAEVPVVLPTAPVRAMRRQNLTRRAAYLLNAARRITTGIHQGRTLDALSAESKFLGQHLEASTKRMDAARLVSDQVTQQGSMLLGWYAKMDKKTTAECRDANGKNFRADRVPLIGYPGTVHVHCRCVPGPAHNTDQLVDSAPSPVATEIAASMAAGRQRALEVLELAQKRVVGYTPDEPYPGRHRRPEVVELVQSSVYPTLERVPGKQNWVDKAGGLPSYIERIAKHLHYEQGMDISRAIATAVSTVKRWAAGGGKVSPETRAQAAKAVAEWEAKKAGAAG